jgi:spore coat polysaccharide biosynthesis predicted glycosyltransferase SpsG
MKRIVIICDFHKNSGFGHFTRMVSLTKSFNRRLYNVVFLFELKNKEFIRNFTQDLNCEYLTFNLKKNSHKIKTYLTEKKIDIVIFDSYYIDIKLEKNLYKNFFLVSIDDKILNHNSHLVFNSREDLSSNKYSKSGQKWFTGKKFILMNKTKKKIRKISKIKKILIHAGGSSAYKLINNFFSTSVKYLSNKDVTVDILYNNIKTSIQIKRKINYLINSNVKFKLLKFNRNFSKKLQNYDLIAGPAGTTTFEAMSSGVLTFSFPLVKDGRDSMLSWNLLGNVTHLNFKEKNEKYIIQSMWDYIFLNFKKLDLSAKKNSTHIQDNSKIISDLIKKYFKKKSLLLKKPENTKDIFLFQKASFKYFRSFLTSRNSSKVRKVSSNPKHFISLPEHLKWWKNPRIKKFILVKNKKIPSAYHWIKPLNVNNKRIIISGWFLDLKEKQNLKISFKIIKHQKELIKRCYKGYNWLININKNNNLSIRMNESIGFKKASENSVKTACEVFKFDKNNFNVYEMKI